MPAGGLAWQRSASSEGAGKRRCVVAIQGFVARDVYIRDDGDCIVASPLSTIEFWLTGSESSRYPPRSPIAHTMRIRGSTDNVSAAAIEVAAADVSRLRNPDLTKFALDRLCGSCAGLRAALRSI